MDVSSAIVGLTVIALAITLMVVGSLLFPDRNQRTEDRGQKTEDRRQRTDNLTSDF